MLQKQAKILTEDQITKCLKLIKKHRNPERDKVMFLLSIRAGLRAKEIAMITWDMVQDAEGNLTAINLRNEATKGKSGRVIPMHSTLKDALIVWKKMQLHPKGPILKSERTGEGMQPNRIVCWFKELYKAAGFEGCSSHSGRRTFITKAARLLPQIGASLRDVQILAGHNSISTTQRYIDGDPEKQQKLIDLM